MESFFNVKKPDEVFSIIDGFEPVGKETVSLEDALGRVLSADITAPEDLPAFFRSVMDGYAIMARDSFGANESLPAFFEVTGEVLMGEAPSVVLERGQAINISTGGMLPKGADSVVMVEYCHLLDDATLEISRAVSPLENVIQPGDDFKEGSVVFKKGHILRPQDLGLTAGLGIPEIPVYKRPKIAIISTGDEVVPVNRRIRPGQVRDINRYTLDAFCRQAGAKPLFIGLCPDEFKPLKEMVTRALEQADMVLISGGSSVGIKDLTIKVINELPEFQLLVHGISISPGKPTIIGKSGKKPVIGLPGHATSALVVAEIFLSRLIRRLSGCNYLQKRIHPLIKARLGQNIESAGGREDYIRVRLLPKGKSIIAEPVFGKSGLISTLVEADGLVKIDMNTEGLYKDDLVEVMAFSSRYGDMYYLNEKAVQT